MKASIIAVGDELLIGQIVDTNAAWLSAELSIMGIPVASRFTCADENTSIQSAVTRAFQDADLVIMTGGLGPTKDDVTKKALCQYFETELVLHEDLLQKLTEYFTARGRKINEANIGQAYLPKHITILPNERGTAQGMWFEKDNKVLISMPGVPLEMKSIFSMHAKQAILKHFEPQEILHEHIQTVGMGESYIADKIADIEENLPSNIKLAYLPSLGRVRLRLSGTDSDKEILRYNLQTISRQIQSRIKDYVFAEGEVSLEEYIGQLLLEHNKKLGTAESCTGGNIASTLVSVPGSSAYFEGSIVSYSYEVKESILGVSQETLLKHGAVSEETVQEMATGLLKVMPVDYALAVSGIAGPGGGLPSKPVGFVWMAVADKNRVISKKFQFTQNRSDNITLTTVYGLNLVRLFVLGLV